MQIITTVSSQERQFRLRDSFLEPYYNQGDPFASLLARSTYLTKYSRGGEVWTDTVRRVVEGNIVLAPTYSEREAEMLFHLFWTGQALPPGRGLWVGGIPGIPADARYNCFSKETRFWADGRLTTLEEAVGQRVEVLCADGKWRSAEVKAFGKQVLRTIRMAAPGRSKFSFEFTATPNHRWITSNRGVVEDLRVGDRICVTPADVSQFQSTQDYKDGFSHGFLFGDGCKETSKDGTFRLRLCGEKDIQHKSLLKESKFFHLESSYVFDNGDPLLYFKSPTNLRRTLPEDSATFAYQAGFIAGWLSADGSWPSNRPGTGNRLCSINGDAIEWAKERLPLLGYCPSGFYVDSNMETNFGERSAPIQVLTVQPKAVEYTVRSITDEGREEDVYCVVEPETHTFTLAGGVPTGNCWYTTLYGIDDWCWVANQLMLGGGVGVGLHSIEQLPLVASKPCKLAVWCRADHPNFEEVSPNPKEFLNGNTPVHLVPDSREGWVDALRQVLTAAWEGRDIIVDVSPVRERGMPIRTFGGIACGPGPLTNLLRSVWEIVRGAAGRRLNSVECLDVTNLVGFCVKSGNVRRSALIVLGDAEDQAFRDAKKDFNAIKSHRHTSNNSLAFRSWGQIQNFDWRALVEDNATYGEPGILNLPLVWKTDPGARGVNPCFTGDTRLATQFGMIPIAELERKAVPLRVTTDTRILPDYEIGADCGTEVREAVAAFVTSASAEVFKVTTKKGYSVKATAYHKFTTPDGFVELQHLNVGDALLLQSGEGQWGTEGSEDLGTIIGCIEGDGNFHGDNEKVTLRFWGDQKSLADRLLPACDRLASATPALNGRVYTLSVVDVPSRDSAEITSERLAHTLSEVGYRMKGVIPEIVWRGTRDCVRGYLRGLFATDGQVCWSKNKQCFSIRLSQSNPMLLGEVQTLLLNFGIVSSVYPRREAGIRRMPDNKGGMRDYWCEEQFDLVVSKQNVTTFAEKVGFLLDTHASAFAAWKDTWKRGPYQEDFTDEIASIVSVGHEKVYCTTQKSHHTVIANGIVTGQCGEQALHDREACNLAEVFPAQFRGDTDPTMAFRLVTRYCLRQRLTALSDARSHEVGEKNMRVGVGLGGLCDFSWTPYQLADWFLDCRREASEYAQSLGVAKPITVTTVKPSGCRPWYALTSTDQGILTLEELFEGHENGEQWCDVSMGVRALQQSGDSSRITKTYDNGKAAVLRIRLACGLEVESTENHQWWVKGRHDHKMVDDARWVRADQIRIGDVLEVNLGVYNKTSHTPLVPLNRLTLHMRGDATDIQQPSEMNPDLAWLLGYMWGDGTMSPSKYRLRYVDEHVRHLEKAQRILFDQFGLHADVHKASEGRNASTLEVGSKMLWHWLIRNDVFKYHADQIDLIPGVVRRSSREDIIAFIAGLIDSDGGVYGSKGQVKFMTCTKDSDFARHLQNVAWSVGLGVGRSLNDEGDSFQAKREMWHLTSNHFIDPAAFALLHRHSVKCSKFEISDFYWTNAKANRRTLGKVEAVESLGEMPTYDIEVENTHWYYAGAVKSHNTISLLNGSSPGIHAPYAEHYVRRARIAKNDPMAPALIEAGVPHEEDIYDHTGHTWVFAFPTKARHTNVTVQTETIRDQFKRQADVQEWWADNAVSATLSFEEHERDELVKCFAEYVPRFKSTSCLPKAHGYDQAPYEAISEEKYREMSVGIKNDHKLAKGGEFEIDECAGGVCPIK